MYRGLCFKVQYLQMSLHTTRPLSYFLMYGTKLPSDLENVKREDKKIEKQDPDVGARKRKRTTAMMKRIQKWKTSQIKLMSSMNKCTDFDQIEHGDRHQTKLQDVKSIKSDNHTFHTSSHRKWDSGQPLTLHMK
ncbi:hypothetical protein M8C21_027699, partial [Ambrosia artemisiifolia]